MKVARVVVRPGAKEERQKKTCAPPFDDVGDDGDDGDGENVL